MKCNKGINAMPNKKKMPANPYARKKPAKKKKKTVKRGY